MAEGLKTTVRLEPIVRAYLKDLAKLGAYGKGRAGVMRRFIENGVAEAIEKKVIAPRDIADFGEETEDDRVGDDD
jgi:hypothetical protein